MKSFFFNLIGCLFTIIGLIYAISYLNMLDVGYSFKEYLFFISHRYEFLILFGGIIILGWNNIGGNK